MKEKDKRFLYSISEEIMPDISAIRAERFALMLRNGESITPPQIAEIRTRTKLYPIFITHSLAGELDTSLRYARSLDSSLFIPRRATDAVRILSTCNFSICENPESAIFSIFAKVPAYLCAASSESRSFAARLCERGVSPNVLIPYTKNRTESIASLFPVEKELVATARELLLIISEA